MLVRQRSQEQAHGFLVASHHWESTSWTRMHTVVPVASCLVQVHVHEARETMTLVGPQADGHCCLHPAAGAMHFVCVVQHFPVPSMVTVAVGIGCQPEAQHFLALSWVTATAADAPFQRSLSGGMALLVAMRMALQHCFHPAILHFVRGAVTLTGPQACCHDPEGTEISVVHVYLAAVTGQIVELKSCSLAVVKACESVRLELPC